MSNIKRFKRQYLNRIDELKRNSDTLYHGLISMRHLPKLVSASGFTDSSLARQLNSWQDTANGMLAQQASYIYESATITLFAYLESFLTDYFRELLKDPDTKTLSITNLRLPSDQVTAAKVVHEALMDSRGLNGTERLQRLFRIFGLKTDLPLDCYEAVDELTLLRNFLCHSDRVITDKLSRRCPRLRPGQIIQISLNDFRAYREAVIELINRLPIKT